MDDLIAHLADRLNVAPQTARELLVIVLTFLQREAPEAALRPLLEANPWIAEVLADAPEDPPLADAERHFGGMARLIHVADRMMALGLTMDQVQTTVRDVVAFARATTGAGAIDTLVRSVPGLRLVT